MKTMGTRKGFVAFMIWATDAGVLEMPVIEAVKKFREDAEKIYKTFTSGDELHCKNLIGQDPIEMFIDYVLFYAKVHVESGIKSYQEYDNYLETL